LIDVSALSANPKFACTGERITQKTPPIWAGGNSTRLFTNPLTASSRVVRGFATKTKALAPEIPPATQARFRSYLTARQQQCLINGCLSSQSNLLCGVPQGSILGPLLFLIYINDLPNCLKFTTLCLYADDTQIFTSSSDISVLANNKNSDLKNLGDWLTVDKRQFHPLKTKLMVVGSTYNLNIKSGDLSNVISIDNNLVSRVPSNKCLGVLLNEKLTFETHIEYICKKACAGIGA